MKRCLIVLTCAALVAAPSAFVATAVGKPAHAKKAKKKLNRSGLKGGGSNLVCAPRPELDNAVVCLPAGGGPLAVDEPCDHTMWKPGTPGCEMAPKP